MPRVPTPAQAYEKHEAKERKREAESKRALSGKHLTPKPEGKAEREYQAELEAKGQLTIFDAISGERERERHVELQAYKATENAGRAGESPVARIEPATAPAGKRARRREPTAEEKANSEWLAAQLG